MNINEEIEKIEKKNDSIIIYNCETIFFKHIDLVQKIIDLKIQIYSDNFNIRKYLFDKNIYPKFTINNKINIYNNNFISEIKNEIINHNFEISDANDCPLIIYKYSCSEDENKIIINRLRQKNPTFIIKNNFNIFEIEHAFINKKILYFDNCEIFIKGITSNFYISNSLINFKNQMMQKYNKKDSYNPNEICVFFGMYDDKDFSTLKNHNGIKFFIWGGTDCNYNYKNRIKNFNRIIKIPDLYFIAISKDIQNRLELKNIESIFLDLNLVDEKLFKPVSIKGNSIYIYNGIKKGSENMYGKNVYIEVVKKFPELNFIFSNELNLPYEEMPKIYEKCFIGLRLTEYDGNANTVQEMKAMNLPVVHNLSDYGLKWKNIDDIIEYINKYKV